MTKSFVGKLKNRIKSLFNFKFFSCVRRKHQHENVPTILPGDVDTQVLITKLLQNQIEEQDTRLRFNAILTYLVSVLEQISKNGIQSPLEPSKTFSKITVTLPNPVFAAKQSLTSSRCSSSCLNDSFTFSDKCIQSNQNFLESTRTKFVQTQYLASISQFDLKGFKIDLIRHIRNLKQDVITLRRFIFTVGNGNSLGNHDLVVRKDSYYEYKFFEAKTRAKTFVGFYKLRKAGDKKKMTAMKKKHIQKKLA